jgi:hypothetical protein
MAGGYGLVEWFHPWNTHEERRVGKIITIVSVIVVTTLIALAAISEPKPKSIVVDKMYIPSGYMYVWDAKTLEQSVERRETRYYLKVQKEDRLVEERVDSTTYANTAVGDRIQLD